MPAIRMLGRKWLFATDDLVFPSLVEIPYRIIWLIIMSIVINYDYHPSWLCNSASDGIYIRLFLFGTLILQALLIPALVALMYHSAKGTITDSRKLVVPLFLLNVFIILVPELMLNIMGTIWIFSRVIRCSLSNSFSNGSIHTIIILTWIRLIVILLAIYTMYDPLGAVNYEDLRTPAKQAWYNKKLTKKFASRLKWALLLVRQDEHSKEAIEEIARLLATLFRSTDLVLSDIVAGCVLLRIRQKRLSRQLETSECEEDRYCTDVNKTFVNLPSWMNLHDAFHYLKLSTAAYGWMYVLYKNLFTGLCSLAPYIRCCCCRPTEPEVTGDNCCMCNYAGLKHMSKVEDKDILFVSFTNKVFEVPFYVIADHERKTIVITIRGTISVPDVVTDLAGTCEPFEVEGLPAGTRAHRGMAMGATKTLQNVMPILEKAFQEHPQYGLVVTGHSLGAAISILLGIKLKPIYPQIKVYAFSAPSGLLSREAAQYTENFVMMVGLGDDVVMRLGILSAEGFRDKLVQALNATKLPKYRILLKGVCYAFSNIPDCDLEATWKNPEDLEAQLLSTPVMPRAFPGIVIWLDSSAKYKVKVPTSWATNIAVPYYVSPEPLLLISGGHHKTIEETERMYNAGRILHITRHKPINRKQQKNPKYKMAWTTPDDFKELLVMPRMLIDHMPESVHAAIKTILEDNHANNGQTVNVSIITQ